MRIVILDGYTVNPGGLDWSPVSRNGEMTCYDRTAREDVLARVGDAEIVLTNKTVLDRPLIEAMPHLRYIGVLATGYNVVDLAAARDRGVPVTNIPEYGTGAVAQYTMALMLELASRVGLHDAAVKQGKWMTCPDFCFWEAPMVELAGRTLGIVGYGRIGRAVAKLAEAFGMNVIAYSRSYPQAVPLDELCERSDVVSLHCPLTEQNHHLFNAERIARMKDGAWLINTARGPLVDEQALADALNSGKLGGAALDVAEVEPPRRPSPLMTAKNCILTPHVAWAPAEARQRLIDIAGANIEAFLRGAPVNVVNS